MGYLDYSFGASSNSEGLGEEEDEANSCSSFSLQECINEFRARRIRRLSTHSREVTQVDELASGFVTEKAEAKTFSDPVEADLINQNISNKEHERKCKPCRDGFCYCFTSDSGEGGGMCNAATASTRAGHVRHVRRHRRSDCQEVCKRIVLLLSFISNIVCVCLFCFYFYKARYTNDTVVRQSSGQ